MYIYSSAFQITFLMVKVSQMTCYQCKTLDLELIRAQRILVPHIPWISLKCFLGFLQMKNPLRNTSCIQRLMYFFRLLKRISAAILAKTDDVTGIFEYQYGYVSLCKTSLLWQRG